MSNRFITCTASCFGILALGFCNSLYAKEPQKIPTQRESQIEACRYLDTQVFPVETCAAIVAQMSPEDELGMVFIGGEFVVIRHKRDGKVEQEIMLLPPELRSRIALNGIRQTIRQSSWVAEKEPNSKYAGQLMEGRSLWSKLRDVFCYYHPQQTYRDLSDEVQTCWAQVPLPNEKAIEEEFDGVVVLQTNWLNYVNAKTAKLLADSNPSPVVTQAARPIDPNCRSDSGTASCAAKPGSGTPQRQTVFQAARQDATSPIPPVTSSGPDLSETISFMNRSVQPEKGFVVSDNHCEIEVMRNSPYQVSIPAGTYTKSTDSLGIPHYGFKWLVITEPAIIRFKFATIDPQSIKSQAAPSTGFVKKYDVDEYPSLLKHPDLSVVWFTTTNSIKSIETGHLPSLGDGEAAKLVLPIFDGSEDMGFIAFESKDRAERFVTAFIHAVNLCGGKASDFAPTPSKP